MVVVRVEEVEDAEDEGDTNRSEILDFSLNFNF